MEADPPKADPPKRKRRWFQFSLRSLMIVVTLLAVLCGYVAWLGKKRIERKRKECEAVTAIVRLGGGVGYHDEKVTSAKPPGPDWLRNLFGETFFSEVEWVDFSGDDRLTDAGLVNLRALPQLKSLDLSFTKTTDAGLEPLDGLTEL